MDSYRKPFYAMFLLLCTGIQSLIELVLLSFPPLHDGGVLEGISLEQIDLLRASAKALQRCAVCSHLSLHSQLLIEDLTRTNGCTGISLRTRLASQAFEFSVRKTDQLYRTSSCLLVEFGTPYSLSCRFVCHPLQAMYERLAAASFSSTLGILPPVVEHSRECIVSFENENGRNLSSACLLRETGNKTPFTVLSGTLLLSCDDLFRYVCPTVSKILESALYSGTPGYRTTFEALTGWGLAVAIKAVLKSACCVYLKVSRVV